MSELDTDLRGLRDELTAAIPIPDVERVTGRARTRQRTQLGAIVAVIVVALAVPVLRALPFGKEAAAPPQSTSYLVDFADPDHGYALARTCVVSNEGCRYTLYRTGDAGKTWQTRTLPPTPDDRTTYFAASLYVLGPDEVTIQRPRGNESDRVYTTDGGRSWRTSTTYQAASSVTAPLARGTRLVGPCGDQPYPSQGCDLIGAIDPDSGTFVPVPLQPPLTGKQLGEVATEGGTWWVTGLSVTTGRSAISMSNDGGQTWSTTEFSQSEAAYMVVERDGVLYTVGGFRDDQESGMAVWRSVDGGRTLTRTGVSSTTAGWYDTPIAANDGSLIVSNGTTTYRSTDMGRTFKRFGDAVGWVKWTRGGYLRINVNEFALSTDGLHWRKLTIS